MGRKKSDKKLEELKGEWKNPREMYVFSEVPVTLKQAARAFGKSCDTVARNAAKDKWKWHRKRYQEKMRARVEEELLQRQTESRARAIEQANARHVQGGQKIQTLAGAVYDKMAPALEKDNADMKTSEGLRVATTMFREGVAVERRGLGLEDQIVKVTFVRILVQQVLQIIQKYVTDPIIYENITKDMELMVSEERSELDEVLAEIE